MSTRHNAIAFMTVATLSWLGCGGIGDAQKRLRTAIDAEKPSLDSCYASALERDRGTAGEMRLWVHMNEKSGEVEQVDVESSNLGDPELESCVKSALVGTAIDPAPKASLKVEYTLTFNPQEPSPSLSRR